MHELVDVILPLDMPFKEYQYLWRIIEPLDSVILRFTSRFGGIGLGQFNYVAYYFIDHDDQVNKMIEQQRMLDGEPSQKTERRRRRIKRIVLWIKWKWYRMRKWEGRK